MRYYLYMIKIDEIQKRLREAIEYGTLSQKELAKNWGLTPLRLASTCALTNIRLWILLRIYVKSLTYPPMKF